MPLLDRNGWKTDEWVRAEDLFTDTDTDTAPARDEREVSALLVPVEALPGAIERRAADQRIGVELPNSFHPSQLAPVQDRLDLVAIQFPKWNDGRGFTLARLLRQQGYEGTIRAVGPLIPDHFLFALECGFDEIEIGEAQAQRTPIEQWLAQLDLVEVSYQQSGERKSILEMRRAARSVA